MTIIFYEFYMELNRIHLEYKPMLRFGQFMYNFFTWVYEKKLKDVFYIEEKEMNLTSKEYDVLELIAKNANHNVKMQACQEPSICFQKIICEVQ